MPDHYSDLSDRLRHLWEQPAVAALMTDSLAAASRLQIDASIIDEIVKFRSVIDQQALVASSPAVRSLGLAAQAAASFREEVFRVQASFFDGAEIQQAMRRLYEVGEASLPPNWRPLSSDEQLELSDWMLGWGWCLAWAPRSEVISNLLSADDAPAALLGQKHEVVEDLLLVLEEVDEPTLDRHKGGAQEAIDSFIDGRMIAAQATSSALLTHVLHDILDLGRLKDAKDQLSEFDPHEVSFRNYRTATVLATIGTRTLENYYPGEVVPAHFNRHASTHTLSQAQYNDVNALVSLLNLINLLRELQEVGTTSKPIR